MEIYIEDDGTGIPESVRRWLLHSPVPKSARSGGTGTGLLLAKNIVKTYGGFIYYEDAELHGTIMIVSLPLDRSHSEIRTSEDAKDAQS